MNAHLKAPQKHLCDASKNNFSYTNKPKRSPQSVQFKVMTDY